MPGKSRKATLTLVALTAALIGTCVLCPVSNTLLLRSLLANFDSRYVSGRVETIPFDDELWRAGKAPHRVGIAQFLVERNLLNGKSRAELERMLGKPDVDESKDDGTRWLLGSNAKGLFDETLWLELTIGQNGTASGATIAEDWNDRADDEEER